MKKLKKKKKKKKKLVRKTTTYAEKKLKHCMLQVFIFFYYSKISSFRKHEFQKQCDPVEDLPTIGNYFSPSVGLV